MYLSSSGESQVNAAMDNLHYFFALKSGPLYAVYESGITVISENTNHNAFYGASPLNSEVVETKISGLFYARTHYVNESDNYKGLNFAGNSQDLGATTARNILKIITDSTGKSLLENAEEVEWQGDWWAKKSTPSKHGLLQKNFYTYYFEEVK